MKIAAAELFRYDLKLAEPLSLKNRTLTKRSGLLLKLANDQGDVAYGDIAPLPGFSVETLKSAARRAEKLCAWLRGRDVPESLAQLDGGVDAWLEHRDLPPSVRFGVEAAVLQLLANARRISLCRLLTGTRRRFISVNALVRTHDGAMTPPRLQAQGFRCLKLKVGRAPLADDIQFVRAAALSVESKCALRLDANRAWDFDAAVQFGRSIRDCSAAIEYIEEPLRDPIRLPDFYAATGLPTALDESLAGVLPWTIPPIPGVAALVLKPTLLGGIESALRFARRARELDMTPVISSAFESGVGVSVLAHLAAAVSRRDVPAGLDTYAWLAEDVLVRRLEFVSGKLELKQVSLWASKVNPKQLRKVDHA